MGRGRQRSTTPSAGSAVGAPPALADPRAGVHCGAVGHDRRFRFGLIARNEPVRARSSPSWPRRAEATRVLDAVRARPLRRPRARAAGRARARGRGHRHVAHRSARARQRLQASGRARTGGGDARPALERPARARHRRGLDDGRLREGRHPARLARRAHRAARRVDHGAEGPVRRRARSRSTASTTASPTSTGSPSRCSGRTRRSSSAVADRRSSPSPRAKRRSSASTPTCARVTATSPDAAHSLTSAATDQKLASLRDAAGARFDDLEIQTLVGFVHVADDPRRSSTRSPDRSASTATTRAWHRVTLVGSESEIVGPARTPPRTLADVVRCGARRRPRRVRADRRASGRDLKRTERNRRGARPQVPVRGTGVAGDLGRGVARPAPARSRTSATRRCSCPITSARSSRRCPRSRWRPRTRRRCASAALVFDNDYKHPAILAKEAATIDLLSRRPLRARHRRGLDEDRLRRARPAVRPARGARRPVRGSGAASSSGASPARRSACTASTTASPTTRRGPCPCRSPVRRSSSAAAASACCRSRRARPTSSASTRTCAPARSTPMPRATR